MDSPVKSCIENNAYALKGSDGGSRDCVISARGLYKSFWNGNTGIDILKNVDFDIKQGETIAVVGASGIGKSTFLHILGTLDSADKGSLMFRGKNIYHFNKTDLARFRNETIGFVFQFHHLLQEFSAIENAMMPALIKGIGRIQAKEVAENMLCKVGLSNRMNHNVGKLSGGEQQRVALARALVLKPDVLLADEPTGNLDKKNSEQIHSLLLDLNHEFTMTVVVVTHNMELASYMSKMVTISDGKIVGLNNRSGC